MDQPSRRRCHPQVESLEDRWLPSGFFRLGLHGPLRPHALSSALRAASSAAGFQPNVSPADADVFSLNARPFGLSYAQWSARWWQYALSVPTPQSPFLDQTGASFPAYQWGNVDFLSGAIVFSPPGQPPPTTNLATANRHVTVPRGTGLFFPVLNSEQDNVVPGGPDTTFTVPQLQAFAKAQQDMAENMQVQIDGSPVSNVASFRVVSPVFSYKLPANNIISFIAGVPVPARTVSPAVSDGVFLFLKPFSPGDHVVHFSGDFGPGNFALDITYHIHVTS